LLNVHRPKEAPVKRLAEVVVPPLATLTLGLFVGFALGQRWGLQMCEPEVFGNLGIRLEIASRIRVGEPDVALRLIDDAIDRALLVAAGQYADLQPESRSNIRRAKLYRTVAPPAGLHAAEVQAFLDRIPMPQKAVAFCPLGAGQPREPTAFERLVREARVEW
jgi:hypothetical protein